MGGERKAETKTENEDDGWKKFIGKHPGIFIMI
jgi:hypothetical protein